MDVGLVREGQRRLLYCVWAHTRVSYNIAGSSFLELGFFSHWVPGSEANSGSNALMSWRLSSSWYPSLISFVYMNWRAHLWALPIYFAHGDSVLQAASIIPEQKTPLLACMTLLLIMIIGFSSSSLLLKTASQPLAPLTGNGHWVLLKDAGAPQISMPFDARQMMLHPRPLGDWLFSNLAYANCGISISLSF